MLGHVIVEGPKEQAKRSSAAIGEFIREQRQQAQVSLRQLARLAGVSNPYLSQIERGMRKPSAEILQQIAKGLRISAEQLYVHAGFLEFREGNQELVAAILADPDLGERQKQVLLDIYDSFRRENASSAATDAEYAGHPPRDPRPHPHHPPRTGVIRMSIASDIRSYADTAVNQGKQSLATAQAQLNDVTGAGRRVRRPLHQHRPRATSSSIADKANEAVTDLRTTAEKAINLDAIKTAIEPYLAQAKEYGTSVTDRAEVLISNLRSDKRVAKVLDTAGVVVGQVQERVVKPVQTLTGRPAKPASAGKPAPKPTAKAEHHQARHHQAGRPPGRAQDHRAQDRDQAHHQGLIAARGTRRVQLVRPPLPRLAERGRSCVAASVRWTEWTSSASSTAGPTSCCSGASWRCGCGPSLDCLTRKAAAFPAVDKLTKPAWAASC